MLAVSSVHTPTQFPQSKIFLTEVFVKKSKFLWPADSSLHPCKLRCLIAHCHLTCEVVLQNTLTSVTLVQPAPRYPLPYFNWNVYISLKCVIRKWCTLRFLRTLYDPQDGHESWVMPDRILSKAQVAQIRFLWRLHGVKFVISWMSLFIQIGRSQLWWFSEMTKMS